MSETVTVTGETPLIETTSSAVGGVVDVGRIESMPLNGRQFANLAATIPGVGLGFHSDPTKSTQYSPQINGGNGRNVNYQIDGGDNNDDTVGGLLQLFPLEAIQEFNFVTSRYKAEYGRSNGGVMNIVTKSGTNDLRGSWFTLFRDKAMNAQTETEKINEVDKQDYRRYQYGGSFGGPIVAGQDPLLRRRSSARSRTRSRRSTPRGSSPSWTASSPRRTARRCSPSRSTMNLNPKHYLSVRYGRNQNSQPYGASPQRRAERLGRQQEHVQLDQREPQLGARRLEAERVHLPVRRLREPHHARTAPTRTRSSRTASPSGQSINTPQTTEQKKWQFRDDFSWHVTGMGRPRPRLQGRRQLHQRAAPVHHVQRGQGRAAATPTWTTTSTGRCPT